MPGKKFDGAKPPIDLVRPEFIEGVARVLAFGAEKYDAWNWTEGIDYSRLYAALQRHVMAWNRGEDLDPETGENHLLHAACELMFLYCFQEWGREELDNRFKVLEGKLIRQVSDEEIAFKLNLESGKMEEVG